MNPPVQPVVDVITSFLVQIGIGVLTRAIEEPTVMPGVSVEYGSIIIDPGKLTYPGDILHEAGHVATAAVTARQAMNGKLPQGFDYLGDEIAAQAWSYAACVHLGLDPRIVFHAGGYHGQAEGLVRIFSGDNPPGVPLLQWLGMTYDRQNAKKLNTLAYPGMVSWLNQSDPYESG